VAEERIRILKEASSSPREEDRVVARADVMPQFPGGKARMEKYLYDNLDYPEHLRREKIEGKAYVSYIIEKDGSISTIDIVSASHPDFGKAAVGVFEMFREKGVKFEPGRARGEVVRVKMVYPVLFEL
jgi:TonB family protein